MPAGQKPCLISRPSSSPGSSTARAQAAEHAILSPAVPAPPGSQAVPKRQPPNMPALRPLVNCKDTVAVEALSQACSEPQTVLI